MASPPAPGVADGEGSLNLKATATGLKPIAGKKRGIKEEEVLDPDPRINRALMDLARRAERVGYTLRTDPGAKINKFRLYTLVRETISNCMTIKAAEIEWALELLGGPVTDGTVL